MSRRGRWTLLAVAGLVAVLALWLASGQGVREGKEPAAVPEPHAAGRRDEDRRRPLELPRGRIAGKVTVAGATPVPGARVCAFAIARDLSDEETREPTCATTDAAGAYRLEGLYAARWRVSAAAAGHQPAEWRGPDDRAWLTLTPGQARDDIDLAVTPGGVEVRGVVADIGGGAIAGALVRVESGAHGEAVTESDDAGQWRTWVAPGDVEVTALAPGYAPGDEKGVAPGQTITVLLTPESVLAGRVVEVGTGRPVEGAHVRARPEWSTGADAAPDAITDADGRFRITRLGPERYKPLARAASGYGEVAAAIPLGIGQTVEDVLIELHPAFVVTGTVRVDGEAPCPDAEVGLFDRKAGHGAEDLGGDDGRIELRGVLPGKYQVGVSCPDHRPAEEYPDLEVTAAVPDQVWIVSQGLSLRGIVKDPAGRPVAGASVRASGKSPDTRKRGSGGADDTGADGRFEIRALEAMPHEVVASAPGHGESDPVRVDLTTAPPADLTLSLKERDSGSIAGEVVDGKGQPVASVTVVAEVGEARRSTTTRDDGTFALDDVKPGVAIVNATRRWTPLRLASAPDADPPGQRVTVRGGHTARARLVLVPYDREIRGRVLDERGQPVGDAFVHAARIAEDRARPRRPRRGSHRYAGEVEAPRVLTDVDGRFVVTGLRAGTYTVVAHRQGGGEAFVEGVAAGDDVTLRIAATASIAGRVITTDGRPPDVLSIGLAEPDASFRRHEQFFRTDGRWVVRDLAAGTYHVTATTEAGSGSVTVPLAEGEQRTGVDVTLVAGVTITGQVVALDDGSPVAGMNVWAFTAGRGRGLATSDDGKSHITDAEGRVPGFDRAPVGPLRLLAFPSSGRDVPFERGSAQLVTEAGKTAQVTVRVPRRRLAKGQEPGDLGFDTEQTEGGDDGTQARLEVVKVRAGGPAAAAGLRVGDVLVSIDGNDLTGSATWLLRSFTRVPPGTRLELGLADGRRVTLTTGAR